MPAVISQAEGTQRQVQCRACEAGAGGVAEGHQWQSDEDGIQNAREVIAGAREQIDITSKPVEAKMKTTAEHVKEDLNHMQSRVGQAGSSSRTTLLQ